MFIDTRGSQLFQVHRMTSEDVMARLPDAGIVHGFEKKVRLASGLHEKKRYQNDFNHFFILDFRVSEFFNELY
ncbi:TPA: hypothetical protein ACOEEN_002023 [Enterobacter kobei]